MIRRLDQTSPMSIALPHRHFLAACLTLILVAAGCRDDPTRPPVPSQMIIANGDGQQGVVGAPLPAPLRIRVVAANGRGVPGVRVEWQASQGTMDPAQSTTDASGYAEARWTLGTVAGAQHATVAVTNLDGEELSATAVPDAPAVVSVLPRLVQLSTGGSVPLSAAVTDQYGNAITNSPLGWTSSNTAVARVDASGAVDAVGGGAAAVIVTAGNAHDTAHVKVDRVAWVAIAAGDYHTCALTLLGRLYCWGWNEYGQLGDGTTETRSEPVAIGGALRFSTLAAAYLHTCAITITGAAYCWGGNRSGEVGDGTTVRRPDPTPVSGGARFTSISAGIQLTCGVTDAGQSLCWGLNTDGQLGKGNTDPSSLPTPTIGPALAAIDVGAYSVTGLTAEGVAHSWGFNAGGPLATINTEPRVLSPSPVRGGLRFRTTSAGYFHGCGIELSGETYCWGTNIYGAIGDGTAGGPTDVKFTPVRVIAPAPFVAVAAGGHYTCGLTRQAEAYCWGLNDMGQLGVEPAQSIPLPARVRSTERFSRLGVNTNYKHTCGVTVAGDAWCWGYNAEGQLGNGTMTNSSLPVRVSEPR